MRAKIVVHGGAGAWRRNVDKALLGVSDAASKGFAVLARRESALNAVEEAVVSLEDDPLFNAGKGSSLALSGAVEMDAAIMDGRDLSSGAVAMVKTVRNPVRLARLVMDKTDHVLLAGETAERLGRVFSLPTMNPVTADRKATFLEAKRRRPSWINWIRKNDALLRKHPGVFAHDTVGAVAVDSKGNFAAAASTGGVMLKLPGRIGDTPLIGAGLYADNQSGAATATGVGEVSIKLAISKAVCDMMQAGVPAPEAAANAVKSASQRLRGQAGVIAIDRKGRVAAVHNTRQMPYAVATSAERPEVKERGRIVFAVR